MGLPVMEGKATYYAEPYIGRHTASGTVYTGQELTCAVADRRMLGWAVLVVADEAYVTVKVDDTGDAAAFKRYGVAVDLSVRAFKILTELDDGIVAVRVWRIR